MRRTTTNEEILLMCKRYLKQNWRVLLMGLALVLGMCVGALLMRSNAFINVTDIKNMVNQFITQRSTQSFFVTLLYSFSTSLPILLVAYCCGLFAFGAPVAVLLPFYKGLGLGVISGYLYAHFGMQGVAFSTLIVLPSGFFSSLIYLAACREAFLLSTKLFRVFRDGSVHSSMQEEWRCYTKRFALFFILILICAVFDSVMSELFMRFFAF